jgi:hypothetical protein
MGNIYIEVDENFRVTKVHRMPFDPVNGMGYTREELERKGFFVNEIPEPSTQVGKRSVMMYNPDIKGVYYENINIPMSDKERIEYLENALNFIARHAVYGLQGIPATMSLDEEVPSKPQLLDGEKELGGYLTMQIISGKLTFEQCMTTWPQLEEVIKEKLADNGIQV